MNCGQTEEMRVLIFHSHLGGMRFEKQQSRRLRKYSTGKKGEEEGNGETLKTTQGRKGNRI